MNAALNVLAMLCLLAAWALLYLASARTRHEMGAAALPPGPCRGAASLLALAAFACCWLAEGPAMGSLLWLALLCGGAFAVVGLATWAPPGSGRRQGE